MGGTLTSIELLANLKGVGPDENVLGQQKKTHLSNQILSPQSKTIYSKHFDSLAIPFDFH
jgi:hypothetical protein